MILVEDSAPRYCRTGRLPCLQKVWRKFDESEQLAVRADERDKSEEPK